MNIIDEFIESKEESVNNHLIEEASIRNNFLSQFPKDGIMNLSLDDYLIAPMGYGNPKSFCHQLRYELGVNSSMGNAWPSTFGIYLKGGTEITLDTKYKKKFGNDIPGAFKHIKAEIARLLRAGENLDYNEIAECDLNSLFKYKLLAVYYTDLYLPAPAATALNAYCDCLGISYDPKDEMVIRNREVVMWKESIPELSQYSNIWFMLFCDWLWRSNRPINRNMFQRFDYVKKAQEIDKEISSLEITGAVRQAVVNVRVNQGIFRERLLTKHKKCCLCGVSDPELLVASHIKPWAVSTPEEKLDENNGLLMCPNHDKLFDKGLISFDEEGNILVSNRLGEAERIFMNVNENMRIQVTERISEYLRYHRNKVFS